MNINCVLKEVLAERGLKASWLAEKCNISRSALSQLMNNKSLPTLEVAYKISEVLDLQVEYIWVKVEERVEGLLSGFEKQTEEALDELFPKK